MLLKFLGLLPMPFGMRTETKAIFTATILCSLAVGLNAAPAAGFRVAPTPHPHPGNGGHPGGQPQLAQNRNYSGAPARGEGAEAKKQQHGNRSEERQGKPDRNGAPNPDGSANAGPGNAGLNYGGPRTGTPGVDRRLEHQEARIDTGIRSGQLTGREVFRLQREETKVRAEQQAAKADGKVTVAERKELNRDLNALSRDIEKQKHDGDRRLPPTPPSLPPAPGAVPPTPDSVPPTPSEKPSTE